MFFSVYTHTSHHVTLLMSYTVTYIYIYTNKLFFFCVCVGVGCIFLGSSYVCVSYHSVRPWNKVSHSLASRLFSPCRVCCVAGPYSFSCTSSRRDICLFFSVRFHASRAASSSEEEASLRCTLSRSSATRLLVLLTYTLSVASVFSLSLSVIWYACLCVCLLEKLCPV